MLITVWCSVAMPPVHAQGLIYVEPAVIGPNEKGIVRFTVSVDGVPAPGFGSYALSVVFDGPNLQLVNGQVNSLTTPADVVACSTRLLQGPAHVQDLGVIILMDSGQGDLVLDSRGGGTILCSENGLADGNTRTYNCGVAGPQGVVTPLTESGALIDFVCFAGPNVPGGTTITITPGLFPEETGAIFPFAQGTSIIDTFAVGQIVISSTSVPSPTAPENLRARRIRQLVLIQWQGADDAVRFRIMRRLNNVSSFAEIGQTTQWMFNDTLPRGTAVADYVVTAENALGGQADSTMITVVVPVPPNAEPEAPQNLQARSIRGVVLLQWQGDPSTTTFHIFRRLNAQSDYTEIGQTTQPLFNDRLPPGTTLAEYLVVAGNVFGMSPESNSVKVIPR
jgi:hypothetical protein